MTQREARKLKQGDVVTVKQSQETLAVVAVWEGVNCVCVEGFDCDQERVILMNRQVKW